MVNYLWVRSSVLPLPEHCADFVKVSAVQGLLDFSENAYNVTAYYEKYGISARVRYTWREAFRTDDTAGGASRNSTLGFPVYTHDRGQLNASFSYDVNEQLNAYQTSAENSSGCEQSARNHKQERRINDSTTGLLQGV